MWPVFLLHSELRRELTQEVAAPAEVKMTGSRSRLRPLKQADKSKVARSANKKNKKKEEIKLVDQKLEIVLPSSSLYM